MLLNNIIILCTVILVVDAKTQILKINQGLLEGSQQFTTAKTVPYYSFKGIPYAEPCIGERKFDIARPPRTWDGTLDATEYRKPCPQIDLVTWDSTGDEDCLYLNVFTPNVSIEAKLPVMVFFYAGVFQLGYANDDFYDPEFLVEKNVIVVTLNYRLGPLGFLSTMDGHAPGNVGMKDQVRALKWVQENIHQFGGDPEKVTLFGQSSGATAVHLHMLSPMSQGLFRACIMQSGTALSWWAMSRNPRQDAFMLGKALGLETNDTKELMAHLKKTPSSDIILSVISLYEEMIDEDENINRDDIFPFAPSVEPSVGQEVFLPDDPWTIMRTGKIAEVPLIIGITENEASIVFDEDVSEEDIAFLMIFMFHVLNIRNESEMYTILEYVAVFYFHGKTWSDIDYEADTEDQKAILQWINDVLFNVETLMTAKIMTYRSAKNLYLYKFAYKSSFGMLKEFFESFTPEAAHGDDLTYLFHTHLYEHKQLFDSENQKVTDIMTKLWTNFARDLNPTSVRDNDINFSWDPLDAYNKYLIIDAEPRMDKNLFWENVKLWAVVFQNNLQEYAEIFK